MENLKVSWYWLCRSWWHWRLSLYNLWVPPSMAKLVPWRLPGFSDIFGNWYLSQGLFPHSLFMLVPVILHFVVDVIMSERNCAIFTWRDHSGYGLSQWETTLQCNVVSHSLSSYPKRSLVPACVIIVFKRFVLVWIVCLVFLCKRCFC